MKRLLLIVSLIIVFFMLALPVFIYGLYQREMAKADELIAVFDFENAAIVYDGIEKRFDSTKGLSWFFDSWRKDIQNHRVINDYWQKKYLEVINEVSASEFIRANSLYRIIQKEKDKTKVLEFLDKAIVAYKTAISGDKENFNAALDYEYLLRVRHEVSNGKKQLPLEPSEQKGKPVQGIHGKEGSDPQDGSMDKIKFHVPIDPADGPTKENSGEDAGKGGIKRKKG